jgi:hypothetical protein
LCDGVAISKVEHDAAAGENHVSCDSR